MNKTALSILLEAIFWVVTALITAAVLYPIVSVVEDYRFLTENIIFIVVLLTCTRYIFLLKHTWLAKLQVVKTGLIFSSIWGLFLLIERLNKFQTFVDEEGPEGLVGNLPIDQMMSIVGYIRSEMLFFGVGAIISVFVLSGRLMKSIWNYKNLGTV